MPKIKIMKKYIHLISIVLWLLPGFMFAQDGEEYRNLIKYWLYRDRFLGDGTAANPGFVRYGETADCPSGDCPGYSVPAVSRDPYKPATTYGVFVEGNGGACDGDFISATDVGQMHFGDGTIYLGFYLAVLATEYELLQQHGENTNQIVDELYFALTAFNRLDRRAEEILGLPADLNGFFVRDDTPQDFGQFFDGYALIESEENCQAAPGDCDGGCAVPIDGFVHAMSQDQAIGMLFGLAFVERFLPSTLMHKGMNLHNEAQAITSRMVDYVKADTWRIKDPNGDCVCRGANAQGFSYGIQRSAQQIVPWYPSNTFANTVGLVSWNSITASFAASPGSFAIWDEVNSSMIMKLAAVSNTWSANVLGNAALAREMEIYDLARAVLHGWPNAEISRTHYKDILTSAPCYGPCFDDPDFPNSNVQDWYENSACDPAPGWMTEFRFERPLQMNTGRGSVSFWGEFPGYDYMLLYNLYHIYYSPLSSDESIPEYMNILEDDNKFITHNYEYFNGSSIVGNNTDPSLELGYSTITSTSEVIYTGDPATTGNATFRAGEEVILSPGFVVEEGSYFRGHIEPFECENDGTIKSGLIGEDYNVTNGNMLEEVTQSKDQYAILLFPNPTTGITQLIINQFNKELTYSLQVIDLTGQQIINKTISSAKVSIDLSEQNSGIYLIRVTDGKQQSIEKVIKTN
jgi:hypothetical protein